MVMEKKLETGSPEELPPEKRVRAWLKRHEGEMHYYPIVNT
jgi:hypothetical protein